MSTRADCRWSFRPVERYLGPFLIKCGHRGNDVGTDNHLAAELCGVSRRTICRYKRIGVPDRAADALAIRLGVHPSAFWPDWYEESP